jgi:D-beta-D-heptose 7-phosphate kinase/D-beta-D-heptose 1-phosphate adenosyltransferase
MSTAAPLGAKERTPADLWIDGHVGELTGALTSLHDNADLVAGWAVELAGRLAGGSRLLVAGNGGSAAEAQHLTSELVGRFQEERRPFSAICLSAETSALTAVVNDYGIEEMFARQVQAHGRPGDVLMLLSTSGRSPNILAAATRAAALGITTWAMTGRAPNPLAAGCDQVLAVDAPSTAAVQAVHLVAIHALCAEFDRHISSSAGSARQTQHDDHVGPGSARVNGREPQAASSGDARPRRAQVQVAEPRGAAQGPQRSTPHVVVVGDLLLDRDINGRTERISPDAPVPIVDVDSIQESPGGAGLAALLCRESGARVTLVAPIASDDSGRRLADLLEPAVTLIGLPHEGPTRRKIRIRSAGQSLVRVDEGGPGRPGQLSPALLSQVESTLLKADVVLVADYGAGVTRDESLRSTLARAARHGRVVWDPHPRGGDPVPGCLLLTPNVSEAELLLNGRPPGISVHRPSASAGGRGTPDQLAVTLRERWQSTAVSVTAGPAGAYLATAGSEPVYLPSPAVADGDPCGAGDRFAASAATALAGGALVSEAVEQAVSDASGWVSSGGAAAFRMPAAANSRAVPQPSAVLTGAPDATAAASWSAQIRSGGGAVVATGGCFDIVHAGHVATLQAARRLGDALVVLINSDASVRRLKGPNRPIVPAHDRARVLGALDCVDAVVIFDEDTPGEALAEIRPTIWVKGGDYGGTPMPEAAVVRRHGGRVVLLPYLSGRSTTAILERSTARVSVPAASGTDRKVAN